MSETSMSALGMVGPKALWMANLNYGLNNPALPVALIAR